MLLVRRCRRARRTGRGALRSGAGTPWPSAWAGHVDDQELFAQALAHRSWCAEHAGKEPNERLEFLGDAVLGLVVTDYLYRTYPDLPEGELAKARAAVVNSAALAGMARRPAARRRAPARQGGGLFGRARSPRSWPTPWRPLIGAIYLDAGYAATDEHRHATCSRSAYRGAARGPGEEDYKTRLQELCAQTFDELPVYRVTDSGPDHAKVFAAEVFVGGRSRGRGEGRSKKQAEQMAARDAWFRLEADLDTNGVVAGEAH